MTNRLKLLIIILLPVVSGCISVDNAQADYVAYKTLLQAVMLPPLEFENVTCIQMTDILHQKAREILDRQNIPGFSVIHRVTFSTENKLISIFLPSLSIYDAFMCVGSIFDMEVHLEKGTFYLQYTQEIIKDEEIPF